MIDQQNGDLLRIAEAIADGDSIDWDTERTRRPDLDEELRRFSMVESIARAHRAGAPPESPATQVRPGPKAHPSAPPDLASWGPLRIIERLGEGSFGEVYRAHDPVLNVDVALKLWRAGVGGRSEALEDFLAEARRLARVRHPNVLTVHGAAAHAGRAGMWTDLVHGVTLEDLLAERGPLGAHEAALIGMDLCRAIAAIHAVGMVHRDVKTTNVLREQGGRIVLMDFGSVGDLSTAGNLAATETMHGTPLAMPPEQLFGQPVGPRADIYGLGVLLYRLVSGDYPIEAANVYELMERHRVGAAVPLRDRRPDLPAEFVRAIGRALDSDPDKRFQSAGAMEQALASVLGSQAPADAGAVAAPVQQPRWRRRHAVLVTAAIAAAAVAIVVLPRSTMFSERGVSPPEQSAASLPSAQGSAEDRGETERIDVARPNQGAVAGGHAVTGPLVSSVHLFRATSGGEERLLPGAHVVPGDGLFLEIEGTEPMHVYVLSEDEAGAVFVLFPAPGLDATNPLGARRVHRLPGSRDGQSVNWQVTSAGGKETVIVVAARKPLTDLERDIAGFPLASAERPVVYGRVSSQALATLRGIGGYAAARPTADNGRGRLSKVLGNLPGGTTSARDPWIWQIELANPGP